MEKNKGGEGNPAGSRRRHNLSPPLAQSGWPAPRYITYNFLQLSHRAIETSTSTMDKISQLQDAVDQVAPPRTGAVVNAKGPDGDPILQRATLHRYPP